MPLGRYTAEAAVTPRDTTNNVSQTIVFWVLPYKAMLVLALLFFSFHALFSGNFTQFDPIKAYRNRTRVKR